MEFVKKSVPMPPIERHWYYCPHCGAKTILYDNTANSSGVFLKCTRGCGQEFELKIKDGILAH